MNVHTPNARDFLVDLTGRTYYVFKVRACQDVHIKLSQRFGLVDVNTYEVRIGTDNNQKTVIIPDPVSSHQESADTPSILSCSTYRYFWVSWRYGTVYVGSGAYVYVGELLRYEDPEPHDVNAAFMETASGQEGIFSVSKLDGIFNSVLFVLF